MVKCKAKPETQTADNVEKFSFEVYQISTMYLLLDLKIVNIWFLSIGI